MAYTPLIMKLFEDTQDLSLFKFMLAYTRCPKKQKKTYKRTLFITKGRLHGKQASCE